jgi:hypothetical protein
MAKRADITPELCRQLLRYEPDTGKLFWLPRTASMFRDGKQSAAHNCAIWNGRFANREAFTSISNHGYNRGCIFEIYLTAHQVAWAMCYGEWAPEIDHRNGIRSDNRIANLKPVDRRGNNLNHGMDRRNKSGTTGVFWNAQRGKWQARITLHRRDKHLGFFDAVEDAREARLAAEKSMGFSGRAHASLPLKTQ